MCVLYQFLLLNQKENCQKPNLAKDVFFHFKFAYKLQRP